MKCPKCKTEGAYVGLNTIECPNRHCDCYDQSAEKRSSKAMSRAAWQETLERIKARARGKV